MAKTVTKLNDCASSVTSVTKRNKRNKSDLDSKRNSVTTPPLRGVVRYACPGSVQKPPRDPAKELALLKAEVAIYLNTYISRGYHAEGVALARLRKAAER